MTILVVDPRDDRRAALRSSLHEYRVVETRSAAEALRVLLDAEVTLILLDPEIPDMTGCELAELIRRRDRTAGIPIVFLPASGDRDLVARVARIQHDLQHANELALLELQLASERRYRNLAEAVPNIVWTAMPDGRIDYLNRRWFEYTGISIEQTRETWLGAVHPDDRDTCGAAWHEALRRGQMFQIECRLCRVDGACRWHLMRAVPDLGEAGQIVGWLGSFTDIDDERRASVERELLYRETVEALRARDQFLSVASHELRTPLSALQLQIEMLLNPPRRDPTAIVSPEELTRKLRVAARQIDRMARLISQLLDVSRITAGRLVLEREQVDLRAIARAVVERFAEEAEHSHCTVTLEAPESAVGSWDRLRIEQIITNLLTNAFKFGVGKPIEISVESAGPNVRLKVVDHGTGIAPEDAERIFLRFEQAKSKRSHGGLGLGLYIVRGLAEAHGGSVHLDSRPGAGSTFTVELPRSPSEVMHDEAPYEAHPDR